MSTVRFTSGVLSPVPRLGDERYRTDSRGERHLLTGFDHNREMMKEMILRAKSQDPAFRVDAGSLAVERDLNARKAQFWEQPQRPLVAEQFVPMDPEAASFTNSRKYEWEVRDRQGVAEMHASLNGVTEAPDVSESASLQEAPIYNQVISYGWTVEDELYGSRLGYNFGTRRAQLAREAIDLSTDRFLLTGAGVSGGTGLFNDGNITPVTGSTGDWYTYPAGGTTIAQVLADFQLLFDAVRTATIAASGAEEMADTVAMSDRIESFLRHTVVDPTNRMTVLEELKAKYPEISNWLFHKDLRDINASKDRIVFYRKDPRVVAAAVPVPYQELPMERAGFATKIYAYGRVAPVALHDARLIQYLDVAMHA